MKVLYIVFYFLFYINSTGETVSTEYIKEFYPTGTLKSEGWIMGDDKIRYWKYYYPNGTLMKKGHYKHNIKVGYWYFYSTNGLLEKEGHFIHGNMGLWWLFYDGQGNIDHKCQLTNGVKDGYCLRYENEKLISAEKYKNGKKVEEWYDFASFKKDNNLSKLK